LAITVSEEARQLHSDALVWDMVWPWEPWVDNGFDKLPDFKAAGTDVLSLTLAGDNHNIWEAVTRVAETRAALNNMSDTVRLCENTADIEQTQREGKLAVLLHFEGTRCFERRLDMVEVFYKLGVKHTLLAFNNANSAAGGLMENDDAGLTHFGRELITEMERVGMMLDLSHVGHLTAMQAIEHSTRPCVFTHSNVQALFSHPRNLSDDEMKACAATGGLIGIASSSMYHSNQPGMSESLFAHLDYMVELLGPEHVGIGLDIIFNPEPMLDWMRSRPSEWPDAADPDWPGIESITLSEIPELTQCMLNAGYPQEAIRNILGGNYMRIAAELWG
jgi:membrane dipeptidase